MIVERYQAVLCVYSTETVSLTDKLVKVFSFSEKSYQYIIKLSHDVAFCSQLPVLDLNVNLV